MAAKMSPLANESIYSCKVAYLKGFDLLKTKKCVIKSFCQQLPMKKNKVKIEKIKMPPKPEVMQKLKQVAFFLLFWRL